MKTCTPEKNVIENKQGYLKKKDLISYIIQTFTIVTVIAKRGTQDDEHIIGSNTSFLSGILILSTESKRRNIKKLGLQIRI